MEKPKKRDDVTIQDLGNEILLYDPELENVHILNNTAHAIWTLCDGSHTLDDMHKKLSTLYPEVNIVELLEDIRATISEFKDKNLII